MKKMLLLEKIILVAVKTVVLMETCFFHLLGAGVPFLADQLLKLTPFLADRSSVGSFPDCSILD